MYRGLLNIVFLITVILVIQPCDVSGEGTEELRPNETDRGALLIGQGQDGTYTNFGQYGAPESQQIKIRISDPTETIHYGFHLEDRYDSALANVPYRILDPDGNVVYTGNTPGSGAGHINDYNEAVAGPAGLGNAGGYDERTFNPSQTGDYVIEFDRDAISISSDIRIPLWDITVADGSGNGLEGRVHSEGWQITTGAFSNQFYWTLYPYDSTHKVLYEMNFNEMQPWVFVLNFNNSGTDSTGNYEEDRKSVIGNETYPQHKVFLNPADTLLYPTKATNVTFNGAKQSLNCDNSSYCLNFTADKSGYLDGYIDVNADGVYNESDGDVRLQEYFSKDTTKCISWDGKDAQGNAVDISNVRVYSRFGHGAMHLPIYDVEHNPNGFDVDIVRPDNMNDPLLYWDDSNITRGNALDGRVNLLGCDPDVTGGCHRWEDRGALPDSVDRKYEETINSWWYASVKYDTIDFSGIKTEPVALSYEPDTLFNHDSTVCRGEYINFYVYDGGTVHYDTSAYHYSWLVNGTEVASDTLGQRVKIDSNTTVVLRAEDSNDSTCFSKDTINVFAEPPVELTANIADASCSSPGSIDVTVTQSPPNPEFHWQGYPDSTNSLSGISAGTYDLNVASPGFEGRCALDTSFTVGGTTYIKLDTLITSPRSCFARNGEASVKMLPSGEDYMYSWSGDGGNYRDSSSVDSLDAGDHNVVIENLSTGCTVDTSFKTTLKEPDFDVESSPEYCGSGNGSIRINAGPEAEITWQDTTANTFVRDSLSEGSFDFVLENPDKPTVCKVDSTVYIANDPQMVKAAFSYQTSAGNGEYEVGAPIEFINESKGDVAFTYWDFGNGDTSTSYHASHTYEDTAVHTITLRVKSSGGCRDLVRKSLRVMPLTSCDKAIPNAFSPNGDGQNDDIGVLGSVEDVTLIIYNRWGEPVFKGDSREERWDGTYRGERAPVGVYPFVLWYTCPEDDVRRRHVGQITLVR